MTMVAKVIQVVGPTASGKTDLGLDLARTFVCPVINADSLQIYKEFDIGTAKPTADELRGIKHYLFNELDPTQVFTAGLFHDRARNILANMTRALMVGGSGFYLRAFETGLYDVPEVPPDTKKALEEECAKRGAPALHTEVAKLDPVFAAKIQPNDSYRVIRALAIMRVTQKTMSEVEFQMQKKESRWPGPILKLGLQWSRDELRQRVLARTKNMLARGWIEEVKILIAKYGVSIAPLQSVGYREIVAMLAGRMPVADLEERIVINTMQLAKRQMTWFRKDLQINWLQADSARDKIAKLVKQFLETS